MGKSSYGLLLLALFCLPSVPASALSVAGVFGNHAVLQQGVRVPVWGTAKEGSRVQVSFASQQLTTTADAEGQWMTWLGSMGASSKGRKLTIQSVNQRLEFENVVVGEVWLASGQSNMQWPLKSCASRLKEVKIAMEDKTNLGIRMLRVGAPDSPQFRPLDRNRLRWQIDSPASRPSQSAVAFFFARNLARELKVPIGIIESSWGGKPIEGFIPLKAFSRHAALQPIVALAASDRLEELKRIKGGVIIRNTAGMPGRIFNSRLAPVAPFAVAGAIWYQGESNAGTGEDPRNYRIKMEALITGWRQAFMQPGMPFYSVQLPAYREDAFGWPRLREEQRLSLTIPYSGMAVTIDLQDTDIHPANKIDVGERLARWPLARQYGQELIPSGPLYKEARITGSTVRVSFHHLGGGLMIARKDGLGPPRETPATDLAEFELAGSDGVWHAAAAEIESEEVVVTSPAVSSPVAVRYACGGAPNHPNLYNRAGLPASPFCSNLEFLPWAPPAAAK